MALESTEPLTKMSTRYISWGDKGGRCVGLTTFPPSCADCLEILAPQHPGTLWTYNRPEKRLLFLTYSVFHPEVRWPKCEAGNSCPFIT